jgi:GT2 family glycosyltransferase
MLSIIIVTWNCQEEVVSCLRSLAGLKELPLDVETLVVDNDSQDGTKASLQASSSFLKEIGLQLILNSRNVGLSSATQQAYQKAQGSWILLCNPDILFDKNLGQLVDYGSAHPNEIVAAEMVNSDGTPQRVIHRRFPTVTRVFFDFAFVGTYLDEKFMNQLVRKNYSYQNERLPPVASIEQPGASFLLLNRSLIDKLGIIFDASFPVWWNDVDLARRAEKAGIRRVLLSDVKVRHGLGSGSRRMPSNTRAHIFYRSMILYARRWKMHPRLLQLLFSVDAILSVFLFAIVQRRTYGFIGALRASISRSAAQMSGVLGA